MISSSVPLPTVKEIFYGESPRTSPAAIRWICLGEGYILLGAGQESNPENPAATMRWKPTIAFNKGSGWKVGHKPGRFAAGHEAQEFLGVFTGVFHKYSVNHTDVKVAFTLRLQSFG
jgi:hypothetical protein